MSESRKQFEKEKAYDIAIINRRGEDFGIDEAITDYDIECEYSLWLKTKNKTLLEALKEKEAENKQLYKLAEKTETYAYKVYCDYEEKYGKNSDPTVEAFETYNNIYKALRVAEAIQGR